MAYLVNYDFVILASVQGAVSLFLVEQFFFFFNGQLSFIRDLFTGVSSCLFLPQQRPAVSGGHSCSYPLISYITSYF
jgi:hypothetical protein